MQTLISRIPLNNMVVIADECLFVAKWLVAVDDGLSFRGF